MKKIKVQILIKSDMQPNIQMVAEMLENLGVTEITILHSIGIITGTFEEYLIPQITALPEVECVEKEEIVEIKPPTSSVQ